MRCGGQLGTAVRRARLWFQEGNCFMSIKSKVLAAAATLTLVGGVGAAGRSPRDRIGGHAVVWQHLHRHLQPGVRHAQATRTSCWTCCARARRSASRSSCSAPATPTRRRTSPSPSRARCPTSSRPAWSSAALNLHYGGSCRYGAGRTTPRSSSSTRPSAWTAACAWAWPHRCFQGEKVTLQPCGVSSKTVWIVDTLDSVLDAVQRRYVAADQRLGHQLLPPVRADLPEERLPDRHPAAAAHGHQPDRFLADGIPFLAIVGTMDDNQLWGARLRRPHVGSSESRTLSNQVASAPGGGRRHLPCQGRLS